MSVKKPSPILVVLSAPSGAGKTTLCARLLKEIPELKLSISTTSREPRGGEQHGREYYFISKEEFQSEIKKGFFAEWAEVHGRYYGTARSTIDRFFKDGYSVLLDIDVQGAESLRKAYPGRCFTVFVRTKTWEILEQRLRSRNTETEEKIQIRLQTGRAEMAREKEFDYVLINDDFETSYQELKAVVLAALQKGATSA
jgi:guanylate kinase